MELQFVSALDRIDLLAASVTDRIKKLSDAISPGEIQVAQIDPQFMNGYDFCNTYDVKPEDGANCVIVEGTRGHESVFAACLTSVNCRKADFNGAVRKHLGVRRVSLANLDFVLEKTGMEYGSITVVGLPEDWKILIDPAVLSRDQIVIGSGLQRSKLRLPTKALLDLPGAKILEGLCKEIGE